MRTIDYTKHAVPDGYVCADCGAFGVKLWREYQTFLENQVLRCCKCAGKSQNKDVSSIDADGKRVDQTGCRTDQIGWLVPAVPTEDGSYWGYTSVPAEGCIWWRRLPNRPGEAEAEYAALWYRFLGGRIEATELLGLVPDEDSRHRMDQLQNLIGPRFEKFAASLPGFLSSWDQMADSTAAQTNARTTAGEWKTDGFGGYIRQSDDWLAEIKPEGAWRLTVYCRGPESLSFVIDRQFSMLEEARSVADLYFPYDPSRVTAGEPPKNDPEDT